MKTKQFSSILLMTFSCIVLASCTHAQAKHRKLAHKKHVCTCNTSMLPDSVQMKNNDRTIIDSILKKYKL